MTDSELLAAIDADPPAAAAAGAGDDAGCAARLAAVLPPAVVDRYVTERGLYDAFAAPADAEAFLQGLAAVAAGSPAATPPVPANPVVARAIAWLQPSEGGLNVGNPKTRAELDALAAAGVPGLTAAAVATVKALALAPAPVSAADVSRAYSSRRPGGRIA